MSGNGQEPQTGLQRLQQEVKQMPRIKALKIKYMKKDARTLFKGKMAENDITQRKLADIVGISPPAFCKRFKTFDFSFEQLIKMVPELGLSDEEILKLMKGA